METWRCQFQQVYALPSSMSMCLTLLKILSHVYPETVLQIIYKYQDWWAVTSWDSHVHKQEIAISCFDYYPEKKLYDEFSR